MAVLQMQKLCICALKKDRKSLMEFLQAAGVLELTAEAEPDEVFKRTDTLEDRQKFERNAATADRALEVLAAVVPEETSMLAGLAGKPLAKAGAYRETEANAEALLGQAERILNLQKQITEEKTAALRLLAEAESLKPWQKLEIPLAYQETKRCAILVGAVGGGRDRILWLTGEGGDGPDRHHGSVLCIFVWSDAFRCGIRIYCIFDVLPGT